MTIPAPGSSDAVAPAAYDGPRSLLRRLPSVLLLSMLALLVLVWRWPAEWSGLVPLDVFPVALHTFTEFAAIVAALLVFFVAWHAHNGLLPANVAKLACGFLAVGLIDVGHVLSYSGMPDFVTPSGIEKAIHFWLVARYVGAATLLCVALQPEAGPISDAQRNVLLAGALTLTTAVYALNLFAPEVWPSTFVAGVGLTPFKVVLEYGVVMVTLAAAVLFCRSEVRHRAYSVTDLCTAALITVLSELCVTLYTHVGDVFMLMGHVYKIIAYFFIYRAVFVTAVREPYRLLQFEVQERREAEKRASFLAYHDALTQLPNRELARDRFVQATADARRHGNSVALVFLDLDHFKNINDSLGHAVGDLLLCEVAHRLVASVRGGDTVSRQGGDEFLLILKDVQHADEVGALVGKLIERLVLPITLDGQELTTSASAGIAIYPGDSEEFDVLMQQADTAMYRAKEEGRNTWRFYDEAMNAASLEKLDIRNGLRHALQAHQLQLVYQPQVNLTTGKLVGLEALLRWKHPEKGFVSPAKFIPVAEDSGLIVPIGEWVMREACRQAAIWHRSGLDDVAMAVNLSAVQFKRGDVEQVVASALEASGLPPSLLELELTESVLISDPENVQSRLMQLKDLGVRLAIDDFGTGYSSLSYLKRFSVDKLKIDQSFVHDLELHPDEVTIVRAIIQMAAGLGLSTIAEGVETEGMMKQLQALGCDEAQGYWVARPMSAEAFEEWWDQHNRQSV
ncbi:putative bifunctional diguanylate cyclase/phosphodiesterase [Aquabacterium sp.]|uniref:putative bifunctional diguanylate cyclase/phosphodiesterase n=1 Tax=Aquabacterium sp. TaxID=1872578 RepID=UPI0035AF360F